ncbi:MAG: protein translocase subunit SecF [Myxococcales bacterium FL481]|nr:MAG: protein translocase subunit SecF [Myxococcales bacterium FL481]
MKFFELVPSGTQFQFVARRKRFMLLSLVVVLLALGSLFANQANPSRGQALNFGIDFVGGSQVRLALTKDVEIEELRDVLGREHDGSSVVRVPDAEREVMLRVRDVISIAEETLGECEAALGQLSGAKLREGGFEHPPDTSKIFLKFDAQPKYADIDRLLNEAGCSGQATAGVGKPEDFPVEFTLVGVGEKLSAELDAAFGEGTVDRIVSSETVGAKVGAQLKIDGAKSLLYAIGFIFLFVMFRFDLRFAPGGIVALCHDAIIVVGAFALTWREFNLQSIAALLTIIGYSINDTIVVFDRVRERVALNRDDPIAETTNAALNDTLSRTILTSGTTLVVVVAIWVLGSGTIRDFAFALCVGVLVGTYSSLFVAAPVFLWVNERFYKGEGHLIDLDRAAQEGTGTLLGGAAAASDPDPSEPAGPSTDEGRSAPGGGESATTPSGEKKASRRRRRRPQS